jgi:hypothetical protein
MNYITVFLLIQMFSVGALKNVHVDQQQDKVIDFFAKPNLLTSRVFIITVPSAPFKIFRFPGFSYETQSDGIARIICFPKDTALWSKTLSKLTINKDGKPVINHSELILPYVNTIKNNSERQQLFDIYALYTEQKNVIFESDLSSKVKTSNFPCPIFIYKKTKEGWVLKEKRTFRSWKEYVMFKV